MYSNTQYLRMPSRPGDGFIDVVISVDINGASSFVPIDLANTDYANIMALVAAGELTIAPAEVP